MGILKSVKLFFFRLLMSRGAEDKNQKRKNDNDPKSTDGLERLSRKILWPF